jgi:hypothetical protein
MSLCTPGDHQPGQEAYNARMGILPFTPESLEMPLHSPLQNKREQTEAAKAPLGKI